MQRVAHPGFKRQVRGVLARNEAVHSAEAGADLRGAAGQAGCRVAGPEAPHAAAVDAPLGHAASDEEREYRALMRKWWFGAAVGVFTMIMSYPWLFPGLATWFPRESHRLWYMWAGMGVASLAVMLYSGGHFFTGAWQALRHRAA